MSSRKNKEPSTLYDLARAYMSGELSMPHIPDLTTEVRAVILRFVPEAQAIIQEQEQHWEKEGWSITLYEYVGYLEQILISSLEEENHDLIRRCLQVVEELLDNPSSYVRETVDGRIVDGLTDLLLEVRELCGPKVLALLERGTL